MVGRVCQTLRGVTRYCRPISQIFPNLTVIVVDREGLSERAARAIGAVYRRSGPSSARRILCAFLDGCIHTGVFAIDAPLDPLAIDRWLLRLATEHPDCYRAYPVQQQDRRRYRSGLTTEDVKALYAVCRTPRERAFLVLVSTTGIRSCAVAMARVGDVWYQCFTQQSIIPTVGVVLANANHPRLAFARHLPVPLPQSEKSTRGCKTLF